MSAAAKCNSKKADIKQMEEKSNERLSRLFKACDETYFGGKMSKNVKVRWSKRMTGCAGTTLSAFKNQPITISLSRPILELCPLNDLLKTLLHEMIHAFLWAEKIIEKEEHGPIFHEHMKRVQKLAGVDLQICHNFEDECGLLLKHVWRCNGPCRKSAPNRGIIRRAINREPSSSEKWFRQHRLECGGTFIKIKEPNSTKVEFDYRLDDEIETFLGSAFPKCTKPNFLENVKNAMSFDTTRERRRRSLSQTEEESPLKKKSNQTKKTPKRKLPSGLKVKLQLVNRKATPYRTDSNVDDLFNSDSNSSLSISSSSSFSSSPSDSPVEKISQKSSKKKNKDNLQIPKTVSKKQQKSNIKKNEDNLKVPKKVSKKALNLNSDLKTDEESNQTKKTPKRKLPSGLKVKLQLVNRKATPYRTDSNVDDLFNSDSNSSLSISSSSSFSSSPSDSPVEKISQKSSKKKNKDNLQIPKTVSKKQQKSNIKKNEVSPLKIPKYVWQCDGKCKEESPNFGKVVRCINKPPSQREKSFSKHHKECGGNFVKI